MSDFQRIGDIVGHVAPAKRSIGSRLAEVWPVVAGPDISGNSAPSSFRAGRLIIATSSSAWAHTLQLMGPQLMERLNAVLGEEAVKEIVFRTAGWSKAPRVEDRGGNEQERRQPSSAPGHGPLEKRMQTHSSLSEAEEESIRGVSEAACDVELGDRLARLMRATLLRQKEESGTS